MPPSDSEASFIIPLPGGRVARVPLSVLEHHVDPLAEAHHHAEPKKEGLRHAALVTFDPTSVVHDPGEWHADWELGPCLYTDETGTSRTVERWHRHPLGTEYAEIYQP